MFKRIIKIILILLAIFLLVLGIIWLIGRHTAEKNGTKVLSFKQFIGLSSKEGTTGTAGTGGANSASFTGNGNANGSANGNGNNTNGAVGSAGSGSLGNAGNITNISTFTGSEISPTGTSGNGSTGNSSGTSTGSGNGSGSGNSTISTTGSSNGTGGASSSSSTAPSCGTADTNITFTPLQVSELNALQNRFYSIAQSLHTDQDVATELANHDAFALKAAQVTELYNYCESKLPLITDPNLQQHVATPFWDAWNASDTPANQFWDVNGIPQGTGPEQGDNNSLLYFPQGSSTDTYLTQIHDNDQQNPDTSGISGPFGQYSFSNPGYVIIDGSILNPPAVLLMPVVEHILRVNLW